MSSHKGWAHVVSEVERSGISLFEEQKYQNQKRNLYIKQDLKQQIAQKANYRARQLKEREMQRQQAEQADRRSLEKQQKLKEEAKTRELVYKVENKRLIEETKGKGKSNIEDSFYRQNPMTDIIMRKCDERRRISREQNMNYDQINSKLIEQQKAILSRNKQSEHKKALEFQQHVEASFARIDAERYAFKKACLDGSTKAMQRLATEPDSLAKHYAQYLQQQISQKYAGNPEMKRTYRKTNDEINDENLRKINSNAGVLSASPAYLGRLPLSHDRQKQLQCIDRQINRHGRAKTQHLSEPAGDFSSPATDYCSPVAQEKYESLPPIVSNFELRRDPEKPPKSQLLAFPPREPRQFRQYNILTGGHIIRQDIHLS